MLKKLCKSIAGFFDSVFRTAAITCAFCMALLCIESRLRLNTLQQQYYEKKAEATHQGRSL